MKRVGEVLFIAAQIVTLFIAVDMISEGAASEWLKERFRTPPQTASVATSIAVSEDTVYGVAAEAEGFLKGVDNGKRA